MSENNIQFFATAAKGTEPALRDELRQLRLPQVRCDRGGVHFCGEWQHGWQACLHSRIALRVFSPLASFAADSADSLYHGVRQIDFTPFLSPKHTLAVSAVCRSSALTHTNFVAQKVKDAIVDRFRDQYGDRPSVNRQDPDCRIFVHLVKNEATIYVDLASESLHRRGYRKQMTAAPLKETLAAAMLRFSGWDRSRPLWDPMCGSGTIAIEAALWAQNIPPGLFRQRFGFERWPMFDQSAKRQLADLRALAKKGISRHKVQIIASDDDPQAINTARINARAAGVELDLRCQPLEKLKPLTPPGVIVTNPPYGKRLDVDKSFFLKMGNIFKGMKDHSCCVLCGQKRLQHAVGLKPDRFWILFNGDIDCHLLLYNIW